MEDNWFRLSVVLSLLAASDCKTNEDFSEKAASFVTVTGSELLGNSNRYSSVKRRQTYYKPSEKKIIFSRVFRCQLCAHSRDEETEKHQRGSGIPPRSHRQGLRNNLPESS